MSSPEIYDFEVSGTRVVVYGRYHTDESFEDNKELIEKFMGDTEVFAWEGVGYSDDLDEGDTRFSPSEVGDGFVEEMLSMSLNNYDYMLGPDSKLNFPFGVTPTSVFVFNLFLVQFWIFYRFIYIFVNGVETSSSEGEGDVGSEKDNGGEGGDGEVNEHDVGEVVEGFELTRRRLLFGGFLTLSMIYSGFVEFLLRRTGVLGLVERWSYWMSLNYGDSREVYMSEAVADYVEEHGESLFLVVGRNHARSVRFYLENPGIRRSKLSFWKHIIPGDDKKSVVWKEEDGEWVLDDIYIVD